MEAELRKLLNTEGYAAVLARLAAMAFEDASELGEQGEEAEAGLMEDVAMMVSKSAQKATELAF